MHFPRVLVLGATGRIGTILRKCWPETGQIRWQTRSRRAGAGWVTLDPLSEPDALAHAATDCMAILCLAGVTPARAATEVTTGATLAENRILAEAAVQAGATVGARVLLASSAAVYGNRSGCLSETAPAPVSGYGRAKAAMETHAAKLGADLGVPVTALRIGNIAGVDAILGGWRPGFQLDRFANGQTPRRSYIGPATLARVLADLAAAKALPEVLNVAAPGVVEMATLLDAAGLAWAPRPAPPEAIPEVRLDVTALQGFTSFPPDASLPETMVAEWRKLETDNHV